MSEQMIKTTNPPYRMICKKGICFGSRWYQSRAFFGYCGREIEIVKTPEAPDWILGCLLGDTHLELEPTSTF